MPSPFPGMDPYLEGEMWQEFHALQAALNACFELVGYERLLDYATPLAELSSESGVST